MEQIVDAIALADLQHLHRAWPAVESKVARPRAWQGSTIPKSFVPTDAARAWQLDQQQRRARFNLEAGRICDRELWGFCDSRAEVLTADGGFIQTFFDGQDRLTSYTTRHIPELYHDGRAQAELEADESVSDGRAPRLSLQRSADDRWVAQLGRPTLGFYVPDNVLFKDVESSDNAQRQAPSLDFAPGPMGRCPPVDAAAYATLMAAGALDLTLIDAAAQPPCASDVIAMSPGSAFCFSQDAKYLLILHPRGPAWTAYAGGGLLDLRPLHASSAWRRLPTRVAKLQLHDTHALRQLGRSQFLVVGCDAFVVLDPLSGATLTMARQHDELPQDVLGWSANGRYSAFVTDSTLRIFCRYTMGALRQVASIDCRAHPPGYVEQIRLFGDDTNLHCAIASTDAGLRHWQRNVLTGCGVDGWALISAGSVPRISVGGSEVDDIGLADALAPHADFVVVEQDVLAGYRYKLGAWHRQACYTAPTSMGGGWRLDLLPSLGLLAVNCYSQRHHIWAWDGRPLANTLDLPPWLSQPISLFFSPLNGDLMALFDPPKDRAAAERVAGFPLCDPDEPAKHGKQQRQIYEETTDGKRIFASFHHRDNRWTLRWAKWVDEMALAKVSRDGTAIMLTEFYSHLLLDFCF